MSEVWLHFRWWLRGKPCYCGMDKQGHGRLWEPRPWWCCGITLNIQQHHVADAFWEYWNENGETHKHGYYESTWGALAKALHRAAIQAEESQDD